jgi:hypothetical protein
LKGRTLIVALALAVPLAGACCAPQFVAQRPYPTPDGKALLAELRARQQALRAADLETRTTSWLGGERTRAGVLMLVERTGRLRFEAEVALQGTVATLVTDGNTFSLLDLQNNIFKQGPACPQNVASLIPVPLRAPEIASILLGDAPLATEAKVVGLAWDGKTAADVMEIDNTGAGSAITRRLWVSMKPGPAGGRWQVVGVQAAASSDQGDQARWRVAFEQLSPAEGVTGGFTHPKLIKFAEPGKSFEDGVEVVVKQRVLNPSFKPQAFSLQPPAGYRVEPAPCGPVMPVPAPSPPKKK